MEVNGRLLLGGDPNGKFGYYYYKIIGDGHCFVNCYLQACCPTYQSEADPIRKFNMARKLRLDFANFLISDSKKSIEEISFRLNILNPAVMSTFLSLENGESAYSILSEIKSYYDERIDNSIDEIYGLILSMELVDKQTKLPLSFEQIKYIYERDHRINAAIYDAVSELSETPKYEKYGIGIIPLNIGYYELIKTAPTDYNDIIRTIDILLAEREYLNYQESILLAEFFDINVTYFPLGNYHRNHQSFTDFKDGVPEMLLINLNNVHWNMISFIKDKEERLLLMGVSKETKDSLFKILETLYSKNRLSI